jgi:tetratricopeptide (TPR) repeat protein
VSTADGENVPRAAAPPNKSTARVRRLSALAAVAIVAGALVFWSPWRARRPAEADVAREDRLTALLKNSREDLAVAEAASEHETEAAPQSARAWSARAFVQAVYIIRGWDASDRRRQEAQNFAKRALALNPNDARAMYVLATVFVSQGAYAQAAAMAKSVLQLEPDNPLPLQALALALSAQGNTDEAIALLRDRSRRFPAEPGNYYNLGVLYEHMAVPDFEAALKCFESPALASEPPVNILLHRAAILAGWRGDLEGARRLLEQIAPIDRTEDRAVGTAMTIALFAHDPDRALAAGELTARDYFEDLYVPGPKSWRLALAYRLAGKEALAQREWQHAEAVLRQRLAGNSSNVAADTAALAATVAWLGRSDEAAKLMAPIESVVKESPPRLFGFAPDHLRVLFLAYYHAGLGDAARAAPYLRSLLNRRELLTDKTLPLDPWWDKIRRDPEFKALLADPKKSAPL